MLSTDAKTPIMTKTTVSTYFLQAFQVLTKLRVNSVRQNLRIFAIDDITLTVEEPGWDLVLSGVLDDSDDSLEFFRGEFTGALAQIDIRLLADQI